MTRECVLRSPVIFLGLILGRIAMLTASGKRLRWPTRSISPFYPSRALQCLYLYRKKARKHDTAFSRHPEMRPRARLTKDLAVRRAEQNQITSFLLRREWQRSWRERIKRAHFKTQPCKNNDPQIIETILISHQSLCSCCRRLCAASHFITRDYSMQ